MASKQALEAALKDAMRAGDEVRKRTIRMALTNIKLMEVDKGGTLDEAAVSLVIQKEIKMRRETISDAQKINRQDIVQENLDEISVLESFLPAQLPAEELQKIIKDAMVEVNATGPSDMGKIMKVVISKVSGRAPNDVVSKMVREALTGSD